MWLLAAIVPGGLVLLALWAAYRAFKARKAVGSNVAYAPLPRALPPPSPVLAARDAPRAAA